MIRKHLFIIILSVCSLHKSAMSITLDEVNEQLTLEKNAYVERVNDFCDVLTLSQNLSPILINLEDIIELFNAKIEQNNFQINGNSTLSILYNSSQNELKNAMLTSNQHSTNNALICKFFYEASRLFKREITNTTYNQNDYRRIKTLIALKLALMLQTCFQTVKRSVSRSNKDSSVESY